MNLILIIIIIFILWFILSIKNNNNLDEFLVQTYQNKLPYHKKLIVIIESFKDQNSLLTFIRNILKQNIKVDSIILISQDKTLSKVNLINNTCILNGVGGLSFFFKESSSNTILLFVFPEGFKAFSQPHFLQNFLSTNIQIDGVVKAENDNYNVNINKVYENQK